MVNGLPLNSLMFFTNWTITIVCLLVALIKKQSLKATKAQAVQAVGMGIFGLLLTAAFVSMLEPIVSVVFGTIWFKDPVTLGIEVCSDNEVMVAACDMPFLKVEMFRYLYYNEYNWEKDWDCIVPIVDGRKHPLAAIYRKRNDKSLGGSGKSSGGLI